MFNICKTPTKFPFWEICKTPKQKEFVGHGNFVKWIENNLDISVDTVSRYIKLHTHTDEIRNLRNLQDAYKQIETIEAQAI